MFEQTQIEEVTCTVNDMTEPNIRPQESGNRMDCRWVELSDGKNTVRFTALGSAFNLGIKRWQYSTLRRCIMLGKPKEVIRKEWMRWVYAGGKQLKGLVKRRQWESRRFFE